MNPSTRQILRKRRSGRLAVLLFAAGCGWAAVAAAHGHGAVNAALDADGRTFTVTAPGVIVFRAGWSATIERGGQQRVLSSVEGGREGTTIRFRDAGVELLSRFEQVDGAPGVMAQAGIRNAGAEAVKLVSVTPVALEGRVAGSSAEWLVTALDKSVEAAPPVVGLGDIRGPLNVHECGGLYRRDGAGLFFGPVGDPIAYVDARIAHGGDGNVTFRFSADMSGVRVDPGETRWGQQVVLLMEPPRVALARWAEWVAKTHGARTDKGALSGWNTWYFPGRDVSGKDVLAVVETVLKSSERLRPGVIQIDGGYEDPAGKAETNAGFPEGLAFYARRIAATGARPGLRVGFSDKNVKVPPADPAAWTALGQRARQAVQSGFTYLKIDSASLSVPAASEPRRTSFEAMRAGFADLRKAAGDETYLLYGGYQPDRATVGAVDASRTSASGGRNKVRNCINDVLRSYPLAGRWFAVDNDTYYMEPSGAWPLARTWMSMVGLSCGAAITTDPWHRDSFKPYWRSVEVMTPPARERTEVLDLCTSRHWPKLAGRVTRDWGEWTVALLWNPGAAEQPIRLHFAEAGLDPERRYAVWSFWDNRFLGVAKGSWTTPDLAPSTSQHLCFTDLDREPDRPVLIGSSLHIYCGAAEIKRVNSLRGAMEIDLTDAGAREGDLFVYSRFPPFLKVATGCTVKTVEGAGENVWRIGLQDR